MNKVANCFRLGATVLCALTLMMETAQASPGNEIDELKPIGGKNGDSFGSAVSISGSTAIVGSPNDDNSGFNRGSAYLFDLNTGKQVFKLVSGGGTNNSNFGKSVAIRGATAIVGSPRSDVGGLDSGSAYSFDTSTGLELAQLLSDDLEAGDELGGSVAISGSIAIVGAEHEESNGQDSGAAYLFDALTGMQLAKLVSNDIEAGDGFGTSVAIHNNLAIVGAPRDDDLGMNSGSAYVFDTNTGLQIAKLVASDGSSSDGFGWSVGTDGSTIIVGAAFADGQDSESGAAYLFNANTGVQRAKLIASDGEENDVFGTSVAVSGNKAIVGAESDDDFGNESGSAYIFNSNTGVELDKLVVNSGTFQDNLGGSVAMEGNLAIAGADRNGAINSIGRAFLFSAVPLSLLSDVESIPIFTGGQQVLSLDGEPIRAGWFYIMFGSVSGTFPGIDFGGGVVLPLNFDAYFNLTLNSPGLQVFSNYRGTLDSEGKALATFNFPQVSLLNLVGLKFSHAYLAASVFGIPEFASNAVSITTVP